MPTVTLVDPKEIPADTDQRSISAALAEGVVITDAKGRKLKIKRPSLLDESRLIRMLGEAAESATYLNAYVLPAAMVVEIDEDAVEFPMTPRMLDAQIQRLDREGMSAVIKYITSAPREPTEETASIKN